MSSGPMDGKEVLEDLPNSLREPLLVAFSEIVKNFREERWGPSEMDGGKLAEIACSILRGYVDGAYPARPEKPRNMVDACRALEQAPGHIPRSVRIQIPRMLIAVYEIRNNRGVGHVGGDVDPSHMDSTAVLYMAKWIVAEMVRLFHGCSTEQAAQTVDALVEREVPWLWEIDGRMRVLNTDLDRIEMVLALLYASPDPVADETLRASIEHPKISYFRRDVLRPAHRGRLIEFNEDTGLVHLSPEGIRRVEEKILPRLG